MKSTHRCSVDAPPDELKKYIRGEGVLAGLRRRFRRMCLISEKHPFAIAVFRSMAAIANEKRDHLDHNYYMIHPFSQFRIYFRGYFLIDLVSSVPYELFLYSLHEETKDHDKAFYAEMLTLIKVFRVKSLFVYLKHLMAIVNASPIFTRVFKFTLMFFLYVHWNACLQYLIPRTVYFEDKEDKEVWVTQMGLWNATKWRKYVFCYYRSLSLLFRTGYGHAFPIAQVDELFAMVCMFLGAIIRIIIIVQMYYLTKTVNASEVKYQEMEEQLSEYIIHKQIPAALRRRLANYYDFRFQKSYFRETEILNFLTGQLRQEVVLHSCSCLVENVTFFNNIPTRLLVRIAKCLRSEIYLQNDVIFKAGTIGDCMFFIAWGSVAVYSPFGVEVCHLEDGDHFGEIALVMEGDRRIASVVAAEECELFRLDRDDFLRVVSPFPDLLSKLEQTALERMEKTLQLDEENRRFQNMCLRRQI